MAEVVQTSAKVLSDLVRYEVNPDFCHEAAKIKNTLGNTVAAGKHLFQPMKKVGANYEFCAGAADELTCDALLIDTRTIPELANAATSIEAYAFLVRGPAIIDADQLPTVDLATAHVAFSLTNLTTALQALGILARREPPIQEEFTGAN